ncbi:MAG: HEAT repeat domain-containing protein [Promethearchaeota archaeon]
MSENEETPSPGPAPTQDDNATPADSEPISELLESEANTSTDTPAPAPKPKAPLSAYDKMVQKLNGKSFRDRNEAIKKLGRIKDPRARKKLLEIVQGDHWNRRLRVAALDAVARGKRDQNFQKFLQQLATDQDQHQEIRRSAITHLAGYRDPKLVPTFLNALKDDYRFIRFWAVRGLIKIGDIKATNALVQGLGDDDEEIRKEVMGHLEVRGDDAGPALIKAFNQPDAKKFLRFGALGLLGRTNYPNRIPTLLKALNDENDRVVTIALRGLGKAKDPTVIQPLIELYYTKESRRRLIESALFRIGQEYQKDVVVALAPLLHADDEAIVTFSKSLLGKLGSSYIILGDLANNDSTNPELKKIITEFVKEL